VVQKKYHGERRNGIMALSIEAFDAHICVFAAGQSITDGRGKLNKGEAFYSMSSVLSCPNSSNLLPQPQLPMDESGVVREQTIEKTTVKKEKKYEGTEAAPEDGNKKQSRKKGLEDKFRKGKHPYSSLKSIPWKSPTRRRLDTVLKKKNSSRTASGGNKHALVREVVGTTMFFFFFRRMSLMNYLRLHQVHV